MLYTYVICRRRLWNLESNQVEMKNKNVNRAGCCTENEVEVDIGLCKTQQKFIKYKSIKIKNE